METGEQLSMNDLQQYPCLSEKDIEDNPDDWINAAFLVATNRERHDILDIMAPRFAQHHHTQFITWPTNTKQWEQRPPEVIYLKLSKILH